MKNTRRRLSAVLLAGALFFGAAGKPAYAEETGDPAFDDFMWELFAELMESDFLNMHYTVRDYEAMGLERPEADLGEIDLTSGAESAEYLESLHSFDRAKLSKDQQRDYDILEKDLMQDVEFARFPDFSMQFDPTSGVTDNLITNFTEYVFYSKQDVEDYLTLLSQVPDYIDQALAVTADQASRGYFITDNALDQTLEGIDRFTAKTNDSELIIDFENDVNELEFLSAKEKADFCSQNKDIVLKKYIPAYQKAAEELEKLRGSRSISGGLCEYPDGEEYYRLLVSEKASTSKSIEELITLCKRTVFDEVMNYVYMSNGNPSMDDADDSVDFDSAEDVLEYLTGHLDEYPEGCEKDFKLSYLDPSIANPNIVAYYLTPCIDTPKNNIIRVNGEKVDDQNDLYMTLAHEGFPGHQYQITWYMNTGPRPVRVVLSHGGYTEGWAMYAETNAIHESTLQYETAEEQRIWTVIGYVLPCIVDMGVNGLGWKVEDVRNLMEELYLSGDIAPDYYNEAVDTPGRLLNYGCGLAQFMNIRSAAEAELGDDFDIKEFNRILLTTGDRRFELVEEDVREWIRSVNGGEVDYSVSEADMMSGFEELQSQNTTTGIYVLTGLFVAGIIILILLRWQRKKRLFPG